MAKDRDLAGITVGELIMHLQSYHTSDHLYMGGLRFNRLKRRGEDLVQLEFEQQAYRDDAGDIVVDEIDG